MHLTLCSIKFLKAYILALRFDDHTLILFLVNDATRRRLGVCHASMLFGIKGEDDDHVVFML